MPPSDNNGANSKQIRPNQLLKTVFTQKMSRLGSGGFEFSLDKQNRMTYSQYNKKSIELKESYGLNESLNVEEIENLYWKRIELEKSTIYSIENDFSLFDDNCHIWHLDKLESIIHNDPKATKKVTTYLLLFYCNRLNHF